MPELDATQVREIVLEWIEEAKSMGAQATPEWKRTQSRLPWRRPMQLNVDQRTLDVYSRDISERGVGLTCRQPIAEGDRVHVRRDTADPWIPTRVAHVTQTVGSYKVGIELAFDY